MESVERASTRRQLVAGTIEEAPPQGPRHPRATVGRPGPTDRDEDLSPGARRLDDRLAEPEGIRPQGITVIDTAGPLGGLNDPEVTGREDPGNIQGSAGPFDRDRPDLGSGNRRECIDRAFPTIGRRVDLGGRVRKRPPESLSDRSAGLPRGESAFELVGYDDYADGAHP